MSTASSSLPPATGVLVRIPEVFEHLEEELLKRTAAATSTALGGGWHWLKGVDAGGPTEGGVSKFIRWKLPVHHSWPCVPKTTEGFIEKAATAMARKFRDLAPQALLVGPLDGGDKYYRTLASNLRGRAMQLFPGIPSGKQEAEQQEPEAPSLFCLVGKSGLFCGMATPKEANGFYPGGTRYISQSGPGTISRAGAKIAEALHYLKLYRTALPAGTHWLEIGASPGGMTSELLRRGFRVTAVDRAPLDPRLDGAAGLDFKRADVGQFRPPADARYGALLSDLNGEAREALDAVIRLSAFLRDNGLVVFTMKISDATSVDAANALFEAIRARASHAGLTLFAATHLTYNRQEFTLFFEKDGTDAKRIGAGA